MIPEGRVHALAEIGPFLKEARGRRESESLGKTLVRRGDRPTDGKGPANESGREIFQEGFVFTFCFGERNRSILKSSRRN